MKNWLLLCFAASACVSAPTPIEQLTQLLSGEFDTHAQATTLAITERFVDKRIRINAPDIGTYVFYQQLNKSDPLQLYRQRVIVLDVDTEGSISQRSYSLLDPERYVDADAARFSGLSRSALNDFMSSGCELRWSKTRDGFRGYVDPQTCQVISSRTGKLRAIESENIVGRDSISLVERGYDAASGEQLFGTPQGQSLRLGRVR